MLRRSFVHIPGIGPKTEWSLWQKGIRSWEDLLSEGLCFITKSSKDFIRKYLEESEMRLQMGDVKFFGDALSESDKWRVFGEFRDSVAYIDIETVGAGQKLAITTIALYDGSEIRTYVQGDNLWEFALDVRGYKVLVTYNGRCFDLPVIREYLGCELKQVHIDLRFLLGGLGYKGGLKACEKAMGISRGDLEDVDGYFAVLIWEEFQRTRDPKALETLLAYNGADAMNLEPLMFRVYNLKVSQTPFAQELSLPLPHPKRPPFEVDKGLIQRIRERIHARRAPHSLQGPNVG